MEEGQNIDVKIDAIDLIEKRISLLPADYVSAEAEQDQERTVYKSFVAKEKKNKTGNRGRQPRSLAESENGREKEIKNTSSIRRHHLLRGTPESLLTGKKIHSGNHWLS